MEYRMIEKLNNELEDKICSILDEGIQPNNIEMLDVLVDIHKDVANEEYWKRKEGSEMYGNYGRSRYDDYNGMRYGDDYGRRERDSRGRYRGHEHLDRMYDDYGRYMESRQRYGANEDTKKSLKYMLESMEDFARMLRDDAQSQEEIEMIRQTAQRIAQM